MAKKTVAQAEKSVLFLNDAADYRNLLFRGVAGSSSIEHQFTHPESIKTGEIYTVVVWLEGADAKTEVSVTDAADNFTNALLVGLGDGRYAGKWVVPQNIDTAGGLAIKFNTSAAVTQWRGTMMLSGTYVPQFYQDAPEQSEVDSANAYLSSIAAFFGGGVDVAAAVESMKSKGAPFYWDTTSGIAVASNFFAQKLASLEAFIETLVVKRLTAVKYINDDPAQGIESQTQVDGGAIEAENGTFKRCRIERALLLNTPQVVTPSTPFIYVENNSFYKLTNGFNSAADYIFAVRLSDTSTTHSEGVELSFSFPAAYPATRSLIPATLSTGAYFVSSSHLSSSGQYIKYRKIKMKTVSSSDGEMGNGAYITMVGIENNQWLITQGAEQLEFYD